MNLEFIRPLLKYIPEVSLPKRHIPFKEKLLWTSIVLILFFIMGNTYPAGVSAKELPMAYQQFKMIFASTMGSIISVGIGPIVTASIVLQLLVGAKMIDIDISTTEGKALFQGTQKILTVIIAFVEGAAVVYGFHMGAELIGNSYIFHHPMVEFTILQVALGSILLMYMDEIVSKWGIGSGIGLFIVGGVSLTIISGSMNVLGWLDPTRFKELGMIPNFIGNAISGGAMDLFLLFPVFATIIVFLAVVFGEAMRLEIPLSYGGIRGVGGRYPLKFFYVSNIPVILAAALLANVQMVPGIVGVDMANPLPFSEMNQLQQGVTTLVEYLTLGNLNGIIPANLEDISKGGTPRILHDTSIIIHLVIYTLVFILLCVLFGKFWVDTTGLGAEQIADQIQQGGMQIPGFRRDKRVVEKVLNRYIPQITIISSIAVGLLAVGADLLGALGSGTGILLTVGILYRLYEEMQKEQMTDMHPAFRRFMGRA